MLYYNNPMDYRENNLPQCCQPSFYSNEYHGFHCPYAPGNNYRMAGEQIIPNLPNSWDLGPIKIQWTFDGKSINAILRVFENAVREVVLTMAKPMVSITAEIDDTTVNLKINADFVNNYASINGAICFDTICTTFNNTVIARW
ncbi:hypothetical protein [Clostridium thermarum]|uniref:hypothetical protein n=1 Tax=Clostridium thermarum TaxID=1716543 RepID=UPI0013D39B2B|nr:hypothetical protein [Clostridium thermarum]